MADARRFNLSYKTYHTAVGLYRKTDTKERDMCHRTTNTDHIKLPV